MKRYLLFDSGCAVCRSLAHAIEQESAGWLEARSLRDPQMRTYFERAQRPLRWEPTLIEVSDQKVNVSTGFALRRKLVRGLGLKRTWHILQLMQSLQRGPIQTKRRDLLRLGGVFLGSLAFGLGIQVGRSQKANAADSGDASTINVSEIPAKDAQALFQNHPQAQLLQKNFGSFDWNQAYLISHLDTGESDYLLSLASKPETPTWVMFSGTTTADGLVIQFSRNVQNQNVQAIFHPDGTLIGSYILQKDNVVSVQQAAVSPDINWGCMYNCIWIKLTDGTISGNAYTWCYACITSHTGIAGAINCALCAYYAGPAYRACRNECP